MFCTHLHITNTDTHITNTCCVHHTHLFVHDVHTCVLPYTSCAKVCTQRNTSCVHVHTSSVRMCTVWCTCVYGVCDTTPKKRTICRSTGTQGIVQSDNQVSLDTSQVNKMEIDMARKTRKGLTSAQKKQITAILLSIQGDLETEIASLELGWKFCTATNLAEYGSSSDVVAFVRSECSEQVFDHIQSFVKAAQGNGRGSTWMCGYLGASRFGGSRITMKQIQSASGAEKLELLKQYKQQQQEASKK